MYTTPQLCSLCRGITVQSLVPHRNAHGEVVNPSGYPHQPSYNALVESAQKCHLCEFFRSRIENTTIGKSSNQGSEENGDGGYYLLGSAKSIVGPDSPKGITTVGLRSSNVSTSITVSIPFGIAVHPDDPLAISGDVLGRFPTGGTNSKSSFDRIKGWFRECYEEHDECRLATDPSSANCLPTRLIDVGLDEQPLRRPCLVETKEKSGSYAALSYCWGKSQTFTTRRETYEQRLRGFELEELPPTVRDAVTVTRELNIPYLWVDAICIIQGDASDWATESSKMSSVYGNAALTISASAAHNTMQGCFQPPWHPTSPPIPLRSKCSTSHQEGTMYIYDMVSDLSAFDKNILHTRGWCLQERLLSPRIVHFAHPQMYWECRLRFLSEDGDAMVGNGKWRLVRGDIAFASVMSSWRVFVADFSKSEFTNTSDKLPALAGLAHTVQRCIGDDCAYLAGIWEKDLPSALLWVRGSGKEVRRSVGWRAPSWSWAALDGEVTYENVGVKETSGIARDREGLARVVEWNMEPVSDANVYGAVRRGWLMVSARVSHVKRGMKGGLMWRNGGYFISDDGGGVVGEVMFDDNTIATPVHFECVLMGSMGGLMLLALAVISTGHEGHYFRVGCARLFGGDYFAGSTARELTLH